MKHTLKTSTMIANLRSDVQAAKDRVKHAIALRHAIDLDLKTVKRIAGRQTDFSAYIITWGINCTLSARIGLEVESFKTDKTLLRILSRALDYATPKSTDDYATEWSAERTYTFDLPSGGKLAVEVSLKGNGSDSCRKVKTGVRLEQVATYEIVCK